MNKNRVAGITIRDGQILLMYRINNGKQYYTFPGGGIEPSESHDDALRREFMEETSIRIEPGKLLYEVNWDIDSKQFFYLCSYESGMPALGDYNEREVMADGTQYYEPKWEEASNIQEMLLYPLEVRDLFLNDLDAHFGNQKRDLFLKLGTCRQEI